MGIMRWVVCQSAAYGGGHRRLFVRYRYYDCRLLNASWSVCRDSRPLTNKNKPPLDPIPPALRSKIKQELKMKEPMEEEEDQFDQSPSPFPEILEKLKMKPEQLMEEPKEGHQKRSLHSVWSEFLTRQELELRVKPKSRLEKRNKRNKDVVSNWAAHIKWMKTMNEFKRGYENWERKREEEEKRFQLVKSETSPSTDGD